MKKRKIFKRVVAFSFAVLTLVVVCVPCFAYDINADNNMLHDNLNYYSSTDENASFYVYLTSEGYVGAYYHANGIYGLARFDSNLTLLADHTYAIFAFDLGMNKNINDWRFYDGGNIFSRDASATRSVTSDAFLVTGYGTSMQKTYSNYELGSLRCNIVTPSRNVTMTMIATTVGAYERLTSFAVFLVDITEMSYDVISENNSITFEEKLYFYLPNITASPYDINMISQFTNGTIYSYDQGFQAGVDYFNSTVLPTETTNAYNRGVTDGGNRASANLNAIAAARYNAGYQDGYRTAASNSSDFGFRGLIFSVVEVPFQVLRDTFDFNLLGINIATFVFSLITLFAVIKIMGYVI